MDGRCLAEAIAADKEGLIRRWRGDSRSRKERNRNDEAMSAAGTTPAATGTRGAQS